MSSKYLIVNAFGRSNRGDSVLLDECIEQLRTVDPAATMMGVVFEGISSAAAAHPDVDWSERIGNAYRFSGLIGRGEQLIYLFVAWVACATGYFRLAALLPPHQRKTLAAYRTADTVISAPGGYIHDTNFAYLFALFHIYLGMLLGCRTVLAPQSLGPIRSRFGIWATRFVLSRCEIICVREGYSRDFLVRDVGIAPNSIVVAGDSAFWNLQVDRDGSEAGELLEGIGLAKEEAFVGATVVDWPFPHAANPVESRARYEQTLVEVFAMIYRRYGLRTVIFNQVASDLALAHRVARRSGGYVLVHKTETEPEVLRGAIGKSQIFVGTRFHSCIFAMMEARPITAISYLPKTEFIMKDLGLESRVVDIDAINAEVLGRLVIESLEEGPALSARIDRAVENYRKEKMRFGEALAGVVVLNNGWKSVGAAC
ncbi:colanic acid/amylovoran biosynthesis protein [Bradyrhizobium sp. GM2.4]